MSKRFFAICAVLLVLVVLLAVFVPGCVPTAKGTIEVKATLCGDAWVGNVSYTLTPGTGSPVNGTEVPGSFNVTSGNWTCAYVSGGPDGAFLESITPASVTVAKDETKTFTLNFELEQDASIEFLTWTINGQNVTPNTPQTPYMVSWLDIIDVHYEQHVAGCQGKVVAVNETSALSIHYTDGTGPVSVYVANNWCAVVKEPEPIEKVSQVTSFNGEPVQPGGEFELVLCQPAILGVETSWLLEKEKDYTKTINWLGVSMFQGDLPHLCLLFELLVGPIALEDYYYTLVSSAEVELVDDEDVNPGNNYAESPPLYLRMGMWG